MGLISKRLFKGNICEGKWREKQGSREAEVAIREGCRSGPGWREKERKEDWVDHCNPKRVFQGYWGVPKTKLPIWGMSHLLGISPSLYFYYGQSLGGWFMEIVARCVHSDRYQRGAVGTSQFTPCIWRWEYIGYLEIILMAAIFVSSPILT